ncbi:hypothetical protein MGSAQ_001407 [marine sediment metagenome]|uniref:Uncharacterized protein n=1 Tax=marine sediment metagenome TaxID=412755 RepID=A0A1B6NWH6_9ZZZZ
MKLIMHHEKPHDRQRLFYQRQLPWCLMQTVSQHRPSLESHQRDFHQ